MTWFISLRKRSRCRLYTSSSSPLHSDIFTLLDFLSPDFVHHLKHLQQNGNSTENSVHMLQDMSNQIHLLFQEITQSLNKLKESILENVIGSYKSRDQELELIKKEMIDSHQKVIQNNLKNILTDFAETQVDVNNVNPALEEFVALYNRSQKLGQMNWEDQGLTRMDLAVKMLHTLKDKIEETQKSCSESEVDENKKSLEEEKQITSENISEGIFPAKYYNKTEVGTISCKMTSGFLFEQNRKRFVGILGKKGTLSRQVQILLLHDIERNKIFNGNSRHAKAIEKQGLPKYSKSMNLLCFSKPLGHEVILYKLCATGLRKIMTVPFEEGLNSSKNTLEILDNHKALLICFDESIGVYDILQRRFIQKISISRISDMKYAKDINLVAVLAHQDSSEVFYLFKINEKGELVEWKNKICLIPRVFFRELSKICYDKGVFSVQGCSNNDDYTKLFILEVMGNSLQISTNLIGIEKGVGSESNPFVLLPEENKALNFGYQEAQEFDWKARSLRSRDIDYLYTVLVDCDGMKVFYGNGRVSVISRKNSL